MFWKIFFSFKCDTYFGTERVIGMETNKTYQVTTAKTERLVQ